MAEDMSTSEFYWDNVFIKVCGEFRHLSRIICTMPLNYVQVEDRLFCVPRYEFVRSSEVFADMFRLPSGPGEIVEGQDGASIEGQDGANTEGQDRKHPIILEGYKKDEFACLLKVMYPTYVFKVFNQLDFNYLRVCM